MDTYIHISVSSFRFYFFNPKEKQLISSFITEKACTNLQCYWYFAKQCIFNGRCVAAFTEFLFRKNLLEWVTAEDADKKLKSDLKMYFWRFRYSMVLIFIFALAAIYGGSFDIAATIIIILWLLSPYIALKVSEEIKDKKEVISKEDREIIERIGKKTWLYYEELVCEKFNFLPPDNYQEYPPKGAAPRTSPTNIGLYLVSTLAAADLGYIACSEMLEKVKIL